MLWSPRHQWGVLSSSLVVGSEGPRIPAGTVCRVPVLRSWSLGEVSLVSIRRSMTLSGAFDNKLLPFLVGGLHLDQSFSPCNLLKDAHTVPAQRTRARHGLGPDLVHPLCPGLVFHAAHADDGHALCLGGLVEESAERGDVAQRQRVQGGTREAADARAGLAVQHGLKVGVEKERGAQRVGARDEIQHATFAGLAGLGPAHGRDDHFELGRVRVGRELDADLGHRLGRGHASPVRRLGVRDGFQVFGELDGIVGRRRCVLDVGARQVDLHGEAEVLVHLGGVGDQGVGHGDLVRRAGHAEDEGFLGRGVSPQVSLAHDLVDVAQIFRERERRVAEGVERAGRGVVCRCCRGRGVTLGRVRGDGRSGCEKEKLMDGIVVREAF